MKTASLLLALGIAQLGSAAPVPQSWEDLVLPEGLSSRSLGPRSIPITRVSRSSTNNEQSSSRRSSLNSGIAFDNRPLSPSGAVPASVALSAPRPLHTTFLQSLSEEKATVTVVVDVEDDGTPVVSGVPEAVAHHYPPYKAVAETDDVAIKPVEIVEVIDVAEIQTKHWATPATVRQASSQSAGEMLENFYADYTPCWKKTKARVQRLVRGKADLIVIGAVLALAVVLWTLESMYGVANGYAALSTLSFLEHSTYASNRVRRNWFGFRQGAIRLEGGERESCRGAEWEKTQA
ncbi:hypothetical protein ACHAQA_002152 [Verticillium albo-atrum]